MIEHVVVVGNNAAVSGDVYEALLVLNGNVHLKSTSRVGVLVDIGGTIQKDPGAQRRVYGVLSNSVLEQCPTR